MPRWLARSTLAVAHLSEGPTSSASISVTDRFSPSGVSQLRWRSRPVTITRSPYESGPWTSQNHGPAGKTLLNPNELVRLGRRYLADQVAEGHALGLQVGAWLARGTGPAAMADACERLQVQRAILPGKLARPSLTDRVLGRTLADFQGCVPARITLVNDDDVLAESDQIDLPGPGADPPARQRRTTSSAA